MTTFEAREQSPLITNLRQKVEEFPRDENLIFCPTTTSVNTCHFNLEGNVRAMIDLYEVGKKTGADLDRIETDVRKKVQQIEEYALEIDDRNSYMGAETAFIMWLARSGKTEEAVERTREYVGKESELMGQNTSFNDEISVGYSTQAPARLKSRLAAYFTVHHMEAAADTIMSLETIEETQESDYFDDLMGYYSKDKNIVGLTEIIEYIGKMDRTERSVEIESVYSLAIDELHKLLSNQGKYEEARTVKSLEEDPIRKIRMIEDAVSSAAEQGEDEVVDKLFGELFDLIDEYGPQTEIGNDSEVVSFMNRLGKGEGVFPLAQDWINIHKNYHALAPDSIFDQLISVGEILAKFPKYGRYVNRIVYGMDRVPDYVSSYFTKDEGVFKPKVLSSLIHYFSNPDTFFYHGEDVMKLAYNKGDFDTAKQLYAALKERAQGEPDLVDKLNATYGLLLQERDEEKSRELIDNISLAELRLRYTEYFLSNKVKKVGMHTWKEAVEDLEQIENILMDKYLEKYDTLLESPQDETIIETDEDDKLDYISAVKRDAHKFLSKPDVKSRWMMVHVGVEAAKRHEWNVFHEIYNDQRLSTWQKQRMLQDVSEIGNFFYH